MSAVCFYFQVHQPFRVRRFRASEIGKRQRYFDDQKNALILDKVARKCYLRTNAVLKDLIHEHQGRFRVSMAITGVAIEQMRLYAPEVLESFQALIATGGVEVLAETYYHSLAALYDENEFVEQVRMHTAAMKQYFGATPQVFRNTELIYSNEIGKLVHKMGFKGVLAEGADDILAWRSPDFVYRHPDPNTDVKILTKNYKLSDDIAFRFSNRGWNEFPLTTEKFAGWVHALSGNADTVNLFMDYETFGEHQWAETGIFDFLRHLPAAILRHRDWEFLTPSEVLARFPAVAPLPYDRTVSWADVERNTSAWNGNAMQNLALRKAYSLSALVKRRNNAAVMKTWRRLLTSDHFYYMCTKFFSDGDVHAYFSPFKSPYEAFLSYMAILEDFELYLGARNIRDSSIREFR